MECPAPIGWNVVRVGEKHAAAHSTGTPCILRVDGCRKRIERKPFAARIAIAKQQEPVTGFADDFRTSGDVITNLLYREFFAVGHGANDLSGRFYDEAEKNLSIECHGI